MADKERKRERKKGEERGQFGWKAIWLILPVFTGPIASSPTQHGPWQIALSPRWRWLHFQVPMSWARDCCLQISTCVQIQITRAGNVLKVKKMLFSSLSLGYNTCYINICGLSLAVVLKAYLVRIGYIAAYVPTLREKVVKDMGLKPHRHVCKPNL